MRLGYHVKVSGAPLSAVAEGAALGCEAIQIFPGNPKQWGTYPVTEEDAREFREAAAAAGIYPVVIHSIYLVNMAAPDEGIFNRSVSSLASALGMADKLGAMGVVTHIGNHRGEGERFGLARTAEAVDRCFRKAKGEPMLLLETTAGAGTAVGNDFRQFAAVFETSGAGDRLGFCLDTCHVFAAGYDIRTPAGVDATLEELDRYIGLHRLKLLHLNDSRGGCGSHLDRHEHIGRGQIGLEAFRHILKHPATKDIPGIIELPHGNAGSPDDLHLLRTLLE